MLSTKNPKVVALPLDDRPISASQLCALNAICSSDLFIPPLEMIGTHSSQYQFENIHAWLETHLRDASMAIISIDMFVYGGLVRSRKHLISEAEVSKRIQILHEIKERNTHCRFYFSSVLLRLTVTLDSTTSEDIWKNVFRYSVLAGKEKKSFVEEKESEALKHQIPKNILDEYLAVRRRNHLANLLALALADNSFLIFGQEDCSVEGLHQKEKAVLREKIRQTQNSENIFICTGADELTALSLLRSWMDYFKVTPQSTPLKINSSSSLDRISNFEDISVSENLKAHLAPTLFSEESSSTPADAMIAIMMFPREGQHDLFFLQKNKKHVDFPPDEWTAFYASFSKNKGSYRALLDLTVANGGAKNLFDLIPLEGFISQFSAYSAWNTTGNSLGTLIAHLGLYWVASKYNILDSHAQEKYLLLRLLDDLIYQSHVRAELIEECEKRHINAWALGNSWEYFSSLCNELMHSYAQKYKIEISFEASLPWPRLFEVDIRFN